MFHLQSHKYKVFFYFYKINTYNPFHPIPLILFRYSWLIFKRCNGKLQVCSYKLKWIWFNEFIHLNSMLGDEYTLWRWRNFKFEIWRISLKVDFVYIKLILNPSNINGIKWEHHMDINIHFKSWRHVIGGLDHPWMRI